jgi:hypothetical protein
MKLINRRYVFTNVKDTNYLDKGKFQIVLPELEIANHINHRLFIKKCIIPYNWKRVTSTTKTITYVHQNGTTHVWSLTEGNPSLLDLQTELTTLFGNNLDFTFDRIQSRFIFSNHNQNQSFTLSTTAWEMLGFSNASAVTIEGGSSYTCPNPVDLRPSPIVEIRADITTAGHEIHNGDIKNTNVLCAIAMNVQPFSHKVWVDDNGLYFAEITNENRAIMIEMTTPDNDRIVPQTFPYFIFGVDSFQDDEKSILETQRESLKLQKYSLLMRKKK